MKIFQSLNRIEQEKQCDLLEMGADLLSFFFLISKCRILQHAYLSIIKHDTYLYIFCHPFIFD